MEQTAGQAAPALQETLAGIQQLPEKKTRAEMTRIQDRELKAIERIVRELRALEEQAFGEDDGSVRVLHYLCERYGLIVVRGAD